MSNATPSHAKCSSSQRAAGSEVPGSEFVSIDSSNHILLEDEPGWQEFKNAFARHVPGATAPPRRDAAARERIDQLSQREQKIVGEIAKGLNNREIAAGLFISEKTVRNHITSIFDKLGVSSRAQAIVFARDRGLAASRNELTGTNVPPGRGAD